MSDISIDMRTHNERVCELSGAQIGAFYYLSFVLQPQCDLGSNPSLRCDLSLLFTQPQVFQKCIHFRNTFSVS